MLDASELVARDIVNERLWRCPAEMDSDCKLRSSELDRKVQFPNESVGSMPIRWVSHAAATTSSERLH